MFQKLFFQEAKILGFGFVGFAFGFFFFAVVAAVVFSLSDGNECPFPEFPLGRRLRPPSPASLQLPLLPHPGTLHPAMLQFPHAALAV